MTSEVDSKLTNELLHRRRLRLQQVREQSKEIAKKIRQRAKVDTLRQVKDFDEKKVKQYLDCQKQFVDKLQELYTNGLENVGAGHRNASDIVQQENGTKEDKSKIRGIEAVAEVRRKKQEILNKKKELLDRKLQARDAANERSREKSNIVAKNLEVQISGTVSNSKEFEDNIQSTNIPNKVDMATQLDMDEPLNDGETDIPLLMLPEGESAMDGSNDKPEKLEKIKKLNLFALSDEMPSSLRGGTENISQEITQIKPSLTLVSEYIQNRTLRLRESETNFNKKQTESLENIKQTILRTRASKNEGNEPSIVCDILEDQFFPVPNWRPESDSPIIPSAKINSAIPPLNSRKFKSIFNSSNNKTNRMLRSKPMMVKEGGGLSNRNYHLGNLTQSVKENNKENSTKSNIAESLRKRPVVTYNHMTRDIKTVPCDDDNLVVRDHNTDDDAFIKAQKQETNDNLKQIKLQEKIAKERRKVAMARENVDKEYRDTLAFLNSLPKDMSNKPNRVAYMDEKRQQQLKDNFERKLEQEYKNIEKGYKNHRCKHSKSHLPCKPKTSKQDHEDLIDKRNQYSWMPVPEKERNLAIHNIPTTHKDIRHGNTVQFSDDNDYHEYRSSHKHTPPTKDKSNKSKPPKNRYVETVLIEQNSNDFTDCTSISSDSSSMEDIVLKRKEKNDDSTEEHDLKSSETDRIIIYKILNSKTDKRKKCKRKAKLGEKGGNILRPIHQLDVQSNDGNNQIKQGTDKIGDNTQKVSFEELKEGIYKTVKEKGDNMESLQFSEKPVIHEEEPFDKNNKSGQDCDHCIQRNTKGGDAQPGASIGRPAQYTCVNNEHHPDTQSIHYPSAATSASSLKTNMNNVNIGPSEGACIKLIDEGSQENGKFYVGTTGFLKNDAYEVVIQLRKKELHGTDVDSNRKRDEFANNAKDAEINLPLQKSDVSVQADTISNKISDETCPGAPTTTPSNSNDVLDTSKTEVQQPVTTDYKEDQNIVKLSETVSPRVCVPPKQATSTYTQTTSSPIHRPIFMHMSSSTSTAYMSPPDLILPRFLKRDYPVSYEETCDSTTLNEPKKHQCLCKHHGTNRRMARQPKTSNKCRKLNSTQNSASSTGEIRDFIYKNYRMSPESINSKKQHTCSKSKKVSKHMKSSTDDSNMLSNKHLQNIKYNNATRNTKTALNPIIKAYVNRLLDLNKEGMKAVEIINQDCSSVPTPASSIINNTLNVGTKISDEKKISLEQIKNILKQNIINDQKENNKEICKRVSKHHVNDGTKKNIKIRPKTIKRKQLHKVKSLNISKKLSKTNTLSNCEQYDNRDRSRKQTSTSSSLKNDTSDQLDRATCTKPKFNRKNSKSPQETASEQKITKVKSDHRLRLVTTPISTDSENVPILPIKHKKRERTPPAHISTQISGTIDSDSNFMKVAEGKLQNMEKIADLTEKCTKRLSNLAKVLEEVRRNKSLVYSQITSSDSQTSDSDLERNKTSTNNRSPLIDYPELQKPLNKMSSLTIASEEEKEKSVTGSETFIPLLTDIPKPSDFKTPLSMAPKGAVFQSKENVYLNTETHNKLRGKPPPALSRIHLRNEQEHIIPHELSTVLEVDSPMSLKLKSKSRIDMNADVSKKSTDSVRSTTPKEDRTGNHTILPPASDKERLSPDMNNFPNISKKNTKTSTDSSDDSKLRMMDLKEFNEIMLKPFISIQEYAKKKNMDTIDEASTIDKNLKDVLPNDDLSSLHSDSSLPDVIAELLKRKIINEPFKFDTASNVNTSTISSESTISLLALSNSRRERKKSFQSKKYVSEMSDSLSISSNPDLEQAFQKLGMGWASSTLKKTKERLALSSSSNTSNSSGVQLRNNLTTVDKSPRKKHNGSEVSKNAEQQTSLPNTMTVKEFLTNELAKKITFTNKSSRDDTEQEFVSLFETKMPDQLKQITRDEVQDQSDNGLANGTNNNRARTSTPVQIFRSMTYHSSSSTNTSNGLFSNADDLSSVKVTSNSIRNHSTSDKDDLTIPNYILRTSKAHSDCSKSDN